MSPNSYSYHYLFIGIFLVVAIIFPLLPIILASFIAPKKPSESKNATYECGLESKGDSWIQFRIQYYIFALVFVIFDVEAIFLFPWATAFKELGFLPFIAMLVFIGILAIGLIYEWRKNALEWD